MDEVRGPEPTVTPAEAAAPARPMTPVAPRWHTILLVGIVAITSVAGAFSGHQTAKSGHLILQYSIQIIWEWLLFAYCVWGAHRGGVSFRELIGGRWNEFEDFLIDIAIGVGAWIGCYMAALVVVLSLGIMKHPEKVQSARKAVEFLYPHTTAEMLVAVLVAITAGICEETIFRAYFQRQIRAWTRSAAAGVIGSALLFGAAHGYQTWWQMLMIVFIGLVLGTVVHFTKSIRPVILSHTLLDTVSLLAGRFVKM